MSVSSRFSFFSYEDTIYIYCFIARAILIPDRIVKQDLSVIKNPDLQ